MIRPATSADVDAIVAMGVTFLGTVYAETLSAPPDPARLRAMAEWLLEEPTTRALFVSERDGQVVGMFGAHAYPHPFTGQVIASELFWWTNPDRRGQWDGIRLLAAARAWAKDAGAAQLHMVAPSDAIESLYRRLGYTKVESAFIGTL